MIQESAIERVLLNKGLVSFDGDVPLTPQQKLEASDDFMRLIKENSDPELERYLREEDEDT